MSHCWICHEPLMKGQKIAVIAFPVECTDDGGDYSFLGDFSKNEKNVHFDCFKSNPVKILEIFCVKRKPATTIISRATPDPDKVSDKGSITRRLHESLTELGEKPTFQDVTSFVANHSEIPDLSGLVGTWFEHRNKFK